jgi:hypothetical protein
MTFGVVVIASRATPPRVSCSGTPGAHAQGGIGHFEPRVVDRRRRMGVHSVHAADEQDLLFQGEFRQKLMGPGFNSGRRRPGSLRAGLAANHRQEQCRHEANLTRKSD